MPSTLTLPEKFGNLRSTLMGEVLERNKEIDTSIIALVARSHHFVLGPPGTAKSFMVRRLVSRISGLPEGGYFQWLMTPHTSPEEIFGPPSLSALEHDEYRRMTAYKLPEAHIAFLDEVWKSSSPILNGLLTALNERLFFNADQQVEIPLFTCFAASNEMPQGDELNAAWDRFPLRHHIKPIQSSSSFVQMLRLVIEKTPPTVIDLADIHAAQQAADAVVIETDVYEATKELRDTLKEAGIEPTERRFRESLNLVRAVAFLRGATTAEIEDMGVLQHVMWNRPEDIPVVVRAVMNLANPLDRAALDLMETIEDIYRNMQKTVADADSPAAKARSSVEFFNKLNRVKADVKRLSGEFQGAGRNSAALEDLRHRYQEAAAYCQEKCFQVPTANRLTRLTDDDEVTPPGRAS